MQGSDNVSWLRSPWLFCGALVFATAVLAALILTNGHPWGDDFAAYLLQARALLAGTPEAEVQLNGALVAMGDWRVGPDAYPWGFPVILAAVASVAGWGLFPFKLIGFASVLVISAATFSLARIAGLSILASLTCGAVVGWQPGILAQADHLGSDLPFAAVSLLGLILMLRYDAVAESTAGRRLAYVMLLATVGVASFALRSNGAVLLGTVAVAVATHGWGERKESRPRPWSALISYGLLSTVLVLLYFRLLPDGSLSHVSYLTLDPAIVLQRMGDHLVTMGDLMPVSGLPNSIEPVGVVVAGLLCLVGIVSYPRLGFLLGVYLAGHFALLTLFRFNAGIRYYFPMMGPIAVLVGLGVRVLGVQATSAIPALKPQLGRLTVVGCALGIAAMVTGALITISQPQYPAASGPYSDDARAMYEYVTAETGPRMRVGTLKPRAMRWFTGREGLLVSGPASLQKVELMVMHLEPGVDAEHQISAEDVEGAADFHRTYSNDSFWIYRRVNKSGEPGLD